MKISSSQRWRSGALTGLALLFTVPLFADDELRQQVHRDYGHRSYMLIEDSDEIRLYLFASATEDASVKQLEADSDDEAVSIALYKVRSSEAKTRVRALTQLAGVDSAEALDVALTLLTDPSPAVRDEAANLILDHPDGQAIADALGLVDEDMEE